MREQGKKGEKATTTPDRKTVRIRLLRQELEKTARMEET
jgi:hypothetical protein